MKNLYMIGGTMGVGKTTACRILKERLSASVFLDGDWCWDMHPFQITPETKRMVMENICFLLKQFLHCTAYENIIFCWVLHEQRIIDEILSRTDANRSCRVHCISLMCDPKELRQRLEKDVEAGIRQRDVIDRSLARLEFYDKIQSYKIDVSHITPEQTAEKIQACPGKRPLRESK